MSLNPGLPQGGDAFARLWERLAALERELEAQKKENSFTIYGERTDLATGIGPRARFGVLSDGTYGAERWTSAGVRTVASFV